MSEVRDILRNLVEATNLNKDTYFDMEVIENLLDFVIDGILCLKYDKGKVYFKKSEVEEPSSNIVREW